MKSHSTNNIKTNIINAKAFIDPNIHKFLFHLLYNIIFEVNEFNNLLKEEKNNIDYWIKVINNKYIKDESEKISKKLEKKNIINIIKFVKKQNSRYAGEILENILIIIFSFGFETEKENTFGKYIYNNFITLKNPKKNEMTKWFIKVKFNKNINIEEALKNDIYDEEVFKYKDKIQDKPLFILLFLIYQEKYLTKKNYNKKFMYYLYRGIPHFKSIENIFGKNKLNNAIILEKEKEKKNQTLGFIKSFFISVYIYYQNSYSPLMKYIKKSDKRENLEIIPFAYSLSEANIEKKYSGIILAPAKIEPRIEHINISKNSLKENGCIELSKVLLFNKNIKNIYYNNSILKSSYINYLNTGLGLFDNNSVEVLNLSLNFLKEDSAEDIGKILSHFKKLKILNLSSNNLKNGLSPLLIALKKLYREGKTKIEKLNLNKCSLDEISFYELGELIKSKYCNLKYLYLNMNNIPSTVNFLKKLKKNRSLTDIYLNLSNINNNDTNNIMRIISNTHIESLYLYKNKINDFSKCLRIIYRTVLIKRDDEKNIDVFEKGESDLYNLDLSYNSCFNKNKDKISLLIKSIENTNLYCLDISRILFGKDPDKSNNPSPDEDYAGSIKLLTNKLEDNQKKYIQSVEEINKNVIDIKKLNEIEYIELFKKLDSKILEVINDEKSIYPTFLSMMAKKIIAESDVIKKEIYNKSEQFDKESYKKIHKNLVKYMLLKKANKNIDELKKVKYNKKMVIS